MKRLLELARRIARRLYNGWRRLSTGWKVAVAATVTVVFVAGSVGAYKGYNYMEHDNRFCTTCHLMDDAFERFNRSAHARVGCHDCHHSTRMDQMYQLYATIFKRPTAVQKHAHVENRYCENCHVRGDPERWRIVSQTAGHRLHMESRDTALAGIMCVDCHTRSLHDFVAADSTCGQRGCHTNTGIRLGRMASLDIYCSTCHNFMAEAPGIRLDSAGSPLTPATQQCLVCHEMRERLGHMEIALDPHGGTCGSCHNPHTQETSRLIDCASAACHVAWSEVAFHRGIPNPERCINCHLPHSWKVEGANCTRCHQNIMRESPTRRATASAAGFALAHEVPAAPLRQRAAQRSRNPDLPRFSHGDHRTTACGDCHSSRERHGQTLVRSTADCSNCHHVRQTAAGAACQSCHRPRDLRAGAALPRTFTLTADRVQVTRTIRFEHSRHTEVSCSSCHEQSASQRASADCSSCHGDHHRPAANCLSCHAGARALATHQVSAHGTCSSSGCHARRGASLPVSRESCLVCHEAQLNHFPGRACETCHRVTAGTGT
jgi:hypothetical protein